MDKDTHVNTAEGNKFIVNLDPLDLSLLPTTYPPWLKEYPGVIWSTSKHIAAANDYIEFEIKSRYQSDEDTQDTTHITCYICNSVVPKAYVIQHLNSSKHIAYQKITETAIERSRKHKQINGIEQIDNSSEYFCDHCVCTIYLSNKNEHEKSRSHKKFVALDAFLNNFALFYTNNETGDPLEAPIAKNIDVSRLKVNNNHFKNNKVDEEIDIEVINLKTKDHNKINEADFNEESSPLKIKSKESVDLISNIESCLVAPHKEMNNNVTNDNKNEEVDVVNNLEKYTKRLKKYGTAILHTVDSYNQDRLRIGTLNGVHLVVPTFNFHGFKKMGKYLECKLCKTIVKDANDHRLSEKHMKIVSQPFVDKHCIRRLENPWSHCVVCNEVTDNVIVHTHFNNHTKKVEQALIPKADNGEQVKNKDDIIPGDTLNLIVKDNINGTNTTALPEVPNTDINNIVNTNHTLNLLTNNPIQAISESQCYCKLCDTQLHVNNTEGHLLGPKHCKNFKAKLYYLMRKVKNIYYCKICETSVSPYTWAIKDHIAATTHIDKYNNYLTTNLIGVTKNGFFCQICMIELAVTDEISHTEMISHQIKLACYNINYIDKNISNIKEVKQKLTNDNVNDVKVSMKGIEEEENKASTNVVNSADITTKQKTGSSIHACTVISEHNESNSVNLNGLIDYDAKLSCEKAQSNVSIKINPVDIIPHESDNSNIETANNLYEKVHKENVQYQTMDVLLTGVNNLLEQLLKCFISPSEIHSHLQRTDVMNELRCKVCTDKVHLDDTEKHTNSLKHIRNHRDLMLANKLKWKNNIYVCYACNVYVESGKELRHIEAVEHEGRMESLKNGDYILISANNKKIIDKIQSELKVLEAKNDVLELEEIKFGDFISHINGLINKEDANVYKHFCNLIDTEKNLICVLCQELVENTEHDIRTHTNQLYHKEKYNLTMNFNQIFEIEEGFVCGYCESIIDDDEIKHIASEKHIANQKKDPKKNYCFICKESMLDVGLKEHLTSEGHIKRVDLQARFYCNICDVQIKNNEANIQRHNESFEHKNNYLFIIENKIVLYNKKCVCQVCESRFNRESLLDHIETLNHIMLIHHNIYQSTTSNK